MGVSENSGTPKASILIGFSIINRPFWGTPIFGTPHIFWLIFTGIWVVIPRHVTPNPSSYFGDFANSFSQEYQQNSA